MENENVSDGFISLRRGEEKTYILAAIHAQTLNLLDHLRFIAIFSCDGCRGFLVAFLIQDLCLLANAVKEMVECRAIWLVLVLRVVCH